MRSNALWSRICINIRLLFYEIFLNFTYPGNFLVKSELQKNSNATSFMIFVIVSTCDRVQCHNNLPNSFIKKICYLKYPSKSLSLLNSHKSTNPCSKSKRAIGFLFLKFCWIAYQDLSCMKYSKFVIFFTNFCVQFDVELWPIISSEIWGVSNWKPVLKKMSHRD